MNILLANLTKMVGDSGGMAKVTCAFAHEMKVRGHRVSLVYSDVQTGDFYYPLDKDIPAYDIRHYKGKSISYPWYLKVKREFYRTFDKQKARTVNDEFAASFLLDHLKDVLQTVQPDVIVSFQPAASKMLLCDLQTKIPVITMSHGDPEDYFHTYPKEEIPALEKSAVCQVLLPSFEKHLKDHLPNVKTVVIGNAIPQYDVQADLSAQKDTYKILFVGRLSKNHKRPHLLIEAFAGLADEFPNWNVELWGAEDGKAYYKELQLLIKKHHLENRVFLKGPTNDVPSVLQQGDIFAFPSAYEGFGLALGEAMSMGLPAVGYKSCSAVNELIKDGENGYLCDDGVEPLKIALQKIMKNQNLRKKLGWNAKKIIRKYSSFLIWNMWEKILKRYSI
ncbi:Glycosyltransferase involved in cell wall bisynthesis [Megasphaera elsdenii]|uniref:glycosyltransferase n=1 Tax=Megasphaera elsdenii TaxID=907 RepID=UPI0008E98AB8|nr:glycosyltransferase [Megasphaera elsdenii]SFH75160.1 Glycosyltransferase involved in cell wall bisynthesis [Megasphaera elsdenii]